jgi:hypothetical protein
VSTQFFHFLNIFLGRKFLLVRQAHSSDEFREESGWMKASAAASGKLENITQR